MCVLYIMMQRLQFIPITGRQFQLSLAMYKYIDSAEYAKLVGDSKLEMS